MTDIQWEDDLPKGTSKYPELLAQIKGEQLASTRHRGMWAFINEFESVATARDLAWRLGKSHEEFDFISRKGDDTTAVYARLKAEVTQ